VADWQALAQAVAPPAATNGSAWLLHGGAGLLLGLAIGAALAAALLRRSAARSSR
jgi:hypothetical protein